MTSTSFYGLTKAQAHRMRIEAERERAYQNRTPFLARLFKRR